jgi:protein SCO1/2
VRFQPRHTLPRGYNIGQLSTAVAALISVAALIGCGDSPGEQEMQVGEAGRSGGPASPEKPPILGTVPLFSLTNEEGFEIDNVRLGGRVWIVSFIFTRCPATCPRLSLAFAKLQKVFTNNLDFEAGRLVSISVDPTYDTPEVLDRYARNFGADRMKWTFLTGDRAQIWSLAKDGFKLAVSEAPDTEMVIAHSQHFALVDRLGRIRGYYDGLDAQAINQLKRDFLIVRDDPGWPLKEDG